jgi:CobQ/CobB/MinD/ParA nucleotide binding domain
MATNETASVPSPTPDVPPIIWVGGSKGGVGKTMVTLATIHRLSERGRKVLVVECDTSNPDVFMAHREMVPCETVDLDEADGWIRLVNLCEEHRDSTVVVNTAARNNNAVTSYGRTLNDTLGELGRRLITLWVINRQRDSLELLRQYLEAIPESEVHVVRNGHFGSEAKFELYNTSKIRQAVEARGGLSLTFPDVADRVADAIFSRRLSVAQAAKVLDLGSKAELGRWRSEVARVLDEWVLG